MSTTISVDHPSKPVQQMRQRWELIDALMDGQPGMLKAGQRWLPRGSMEHPKDYQRRLHLSVLNPGFSQTVKTFVGKPFSSPIVLSDDMPQHIRDWSEDIDCCGNNLDVFARNVFLDAITHGITYIMVDYPKAENINTRADELNQGVRPYWVHIKAAQMLGWQAKKINNRERLTRVRILEHIHAPSNDPWDDDNLIRQVRVLYPDRYELYRENDDQWSLYETGLNTLGEVPIVPTYANQTGLMQGLPPLEDLAFINLAHWRSTSEQNNIEHIVRVPFLFGKGFEPSVFSQPETGEYALALDSSRALIVKDVDASLSWVEHAGNAIEVGRQSLKDLVEQMAIIGAQKLVRNPGNRTATAEAIETSQSEIELGAMVANLEHALNQALLLTGKWLRLAYPGRIDIAPDWQSIEINDQTFATLLELRCMGDISHEQLIQALKNKKVLDEDFDMKLNQQQLETEREQQSIPHIPSFLSGQATENLKA